MCCCPESCGFEVSETVLPNKMTPLFTAFNFAHDFRVTLYLSGDELREIHILFSGKYGICITLVALIYRYVFHDLDEALKI
jgi:hypothetical protein